LKIENFINNHNFFLTLIIFFIMTKSVNIRFFLTAILAIAMMSCSGKKDKDNGDNGGLAKPGTLAPPAWTHGSWGNEGVVDVVFKFTPDDVLQLGQVSLKSLAFSTVGYTATISETKKTDNLYEITLKAKAGNVEEVSAFYSFKKGDGAYIEMGAAEGGTTIVEYGKIYKR
jgi:hypothetical protein